MGIVTIRITTVCSCLIGITTTAITTTDTITTGTITIMAITTTATFTSIGTLIMAACTSIWGDCISVTACTTKGAAG